MRVERSSAERSRSRPMGGFAVLLLLGLAACGDAPRAVAPPDAVGDRLVLAEGWPDPTAASEPLLPWTLEAQADVIALAAVHEPLVQGERTVLELELTDFLKGQSTAETVFPEDAQPFLGCIPPETIARPSEHFPAGSEALVYLTRRADGGLSILQLVRKPDDRSLAAIRRFVELEAAVAAADPDWTEILPPDGRLDNLTHWALVHTRPAGAATPLRAMLERTLERVEQGGPSDAAHMNLVVAHLTSQNAEPASLPLLERVARWVLALPDDREFRRHWPECSPGRLLARAPADAVQRWEELLRKLLKRSETYEHAYQGTANALAYLPGGAGVPALLEALGGQRPVIAAALAHWARNNPDYRARRAEVRSRADDLRDRAAGDTLLTFRRHLDVLIEALSD